MSPPDDAPAVPGHSHRPPRVRPTDVPETVPRPDESDAEAAERLRTRRQDPWGEPEDQPDHRDNEVYEQQREQRR